METVFIAALQLIKGIGTAKIQALIAYFGSGKCVWQASLADLEASKCIDRSLCYQFVEQRRLLDVDSLAEVWTNKDIKICCQSDELYPEMLRQIFNPPLVLFYRGELTKNDDKRLAIVGARQATAYGKTIAKRLAEELTSAGVEVVSGAARGIDTAAHEGALVKGRTIAVLGCGIDVVYPKENKRLLEEIAQNGVIISEYPPGTTAHPAYFPARNRIISGISRGVVVVEASLKSGSLITAEMALNEGRDVFAVPGSIFSELSAGCHRLLQEGAKLVASSQDLFAEYEWHRSLLANSVTVLTAEELAVYKVLNSVLPLSIDEIIIKTKNDVSQIAVVLLQLQLRGLVKESSSRCYVRMVKEDVL